MWIIPGGHAGGSGAEATEETLGSGGATDAASCAGLGPLVPLSTTITPATIAATTAPSPTKRPIFPEPEGAGLPVVAEARFVDAPDVPADKLADGASTVAAAATIGSLETRPPGRLLPDSSPIRIGAI